MKHACIWHFYCWIWSYQYSNIQFLINYLYSVITSLCIQKSFLPNTQNMKAIVIEGISTKRTSCDFIWYLEIVQRSSLKKIPFHFLFDPSSYDDLHRRKEIARGNWISMFTKASVFDLPSYLILDYCFNSLLSLLCYYILFCISQIPQFTWWIYLVIMCILFTFR